MRLTQWFCKFELCPQKFYQTFEDFEVAHRRISLMSTGHKINIEDIKHKSLSNVLNMFKMF